MPRIAGVDIPLNKKVSISLTYIYGIGRSTAMDILSATGVDPEKRVKDLTPEEEAKLREYIDKNYKVEGDLRRLITQNIKRLKTINCYRGIRHQKGLPVRGQQTRTNARTRKGKKTTIGSGKKKMTKK